MDVSLSMDNDSGYVSLNPESMDFSSESLVKPKSCTTHELYLSEDALLEEPTLQRRHIQCQKFDSFDSVINCSEESVKTEFSGFDDSDRSNVSFVVSEVKPITWDSHEWKESNRINDKSDINCSNESEKTLSEVLGKSIIVSHKVFANVTNTYDQNLNQSVIKNVLNDDDKENIRPSETPKKQYENHQSADVSPDLFDDEESNIMPHKQKSPVKKENCSSKEVKLLKKVQNCLSGVYPPPNLTIVQMTPSEILDKIKHNKHLFWKTCDVTNCQNNSLLIDDVPVPVHKEWPDILHSRYHGLHYNRSKISEEFEHLCSRYAERYVGAETQSTCTVFELDPPTSIKRKFSKPRWVAKSPGRRLSHLARRRITFSSANIQSSGSSAILGSRARQILIDAKKSNFLSKKSPRKSPRRTPSKSPFKARKNTPSSSAKKKLALRFRQMSGEFENTASSSTSDRSFLTLKRALFVSPKNENSSIIPGVLERKSTKRALFSSPVKQSPQKKSPCKLDRKRKRSDLEEDNPSKFVRNMSLDIQPSRTEQTLNRTLSEASIRPSTSRLEELSDQHKKKLQWAVYDSLRLQNISSTHPQYKVFASVLARVTRRFLQNLRIEGGTTEKMCRIARHHSYAVVKGKTVDEIMNDYMKNKLKNQKPQGYVGINVTNNLTSQTVSSADKENVLKHKVAIMESIEKRREHAGSKSKFHGDSRIDRIRKVISFEERFPKDV